MPPAVQQTPPSLGEMLDADDATPGEDGREAVGDLVEEDDEKAQGPEQRRCPRARARGR